MGEKKEYTKQVFYPNHKKKPYSCKKCEWKGLGEEAKFGEQVQDIGFDLICPNCKGYEYLGFVDFPYLEDVAKNGTGIDKLMANQSLEFLDALEKSYLKNPDQLPEINCWQLTFVMQEKEIDEKKYLVITNEGNEIWRENGSWEFYHRFLAIGDILIKKYGKRLMDFVPDVDWVNIYGDNISAPEHVHNFRMKIRKNYNKRIEEKDSDSIPRPDFNNVSLTNHLDDTPLTPELKEKLTEKFDDMLKELDEMDDDSQDK